MEPKDYETVFEEFHQYLSDSEVARIQAEQEIANLIPTLPINK